MKKKLSFIYITCFIVILFFYQVILPYNKNIIQTIIFSFVPSLLPCLFLTQWIINSGSLDDIYDILKSNFFTRIIYFLILILILISLGLPSSYFLLLDQKEKKIIKEKDFNNAIFSLGPLSLPFLYTLCLNLNKGILILSINYLVTISSLIFNSFKINIVNIKNNSISYTKAFKKSVDKTFSTLMMIIIVVIISSLPLFLFEKINYPIKYLFEGLIEFSYPSYNASLTNNHLIVLFISLYPSLTIILQTKMIYKDFKIKNYILHRLFLMIIGILIYFLFS